MSRKDNRSNIYNYIIEYIKTNGYAPTVREICNGVGIKSTSTIHLHLKKLNDNGLLEVKFGESRAIKVIGYKFIRE